MAIERKTFKLPKGFDPNRHGSEVLTRAVVERLGEGWEVVDVDVAAGNGTAERQSAVLAVSDEPAPRGRDARRTKTVNLPGKTRPSDGDRLDAKFPDQYPGYFMTSFEPFLGRAQLTKLSDDEARARGALATALGCKPWDVQVTTRPDGGFTVSLPRSYTPSRHDAKLEEVATSVVGQDGWYVNVDARALRAQIIPSEPPTFPDVLPTELAALGRGSIDFSPFGRVLPDPGSASGDEIGLDWTASAFAIISGTPGSGKSVTLNRLVAEQVSHGAELVVVDDPAKSVDFLWCKDFVRDGGWGCESDLAAVAALAMVHEEGQRRAEILKRLGINNWLDMPAGERFAPLFVIVDELSALLVTDKVPAGIPKSHPLVQEALEVNLRKAMMEKWIGKIVAELRFVGVRMVLSTQVTNANTGVPPSLRAKIGHKVLQGSNPSKSARTQTFSDEQAVPVVPANVQASGRVARGVGAADLEGSRPAIYKSYFATTDDYRRRLDELGVPRSSRPEPSAAEIARHSPSLEDDGEDFRPPSRLDSGGFGERDGRDAPAPRLQGAARAAHELRLAEVEHARATSGGPTTAPPW